MDSAFEVIFQKDGDILTVRPNGRLDSVTAPVYADQLEKELEGVSQIVMDLEQVDYIASAGLRVLLTSEQKMEERGGGVRLINVSGNIREVLELTGFLDFITVE